MGRFLLPLTLAAALGTAGCTDRYGNVDPVATGLLGAGIGAAAGLAIASANQPRVYHRAPGWGYGRAQPGWGHPGWRHHGGWHSGPRHGWGHPGWQHRPHHAWGHGGWHHRPRYW